MSPYWLEDAGRFLQCVLLIVVLALGVNFGVDLMQNLRGPHATPCCDDRSE